MTTILEEITSNWNAEINKRKQIFKKIVAELKINYKYPKSTFASIEKYRNIYQKTRKELHDLEIQKEKLDKLIQSTKDNVNSSRSNMLHMNKILQTMDLMDCNNVMMYENDDQDVGFIIDKEEFHVDLNDVGEASLTPIREYFKNKRKTLMEDNNEAVPPGISPINEESEFEDLEDLEDLEDYANADIIPGLQSLEDSEPRSLGEMSSTFRTME